MCCGAATTEPMECQLESLHSEPLQHDAELRQLLCCAGSTMAAPCQPAPGATELRAASDAGAFRQHVLVWGVTRQTSRLRTADADNTVDSRVPSLLGHTT